MADYDQLTNFRIVGLYNTIIGDTTGQLGDPDTRPDMFNVNMSATIREFVLDDPSNDVHIRMVTAVPPRTLILAPIEARVESGVLRLPGADAGIDGVELTAKSSMMGLGDRVLACEVTFGPAIIGGRTFQYDRIVFAVPVIEAADYHPGVHQKLTIVGGPTGGTWNVAYGDQPIANQGIAATQASVQAALRNVAAIGNNVTVTGPVAGPKGPEYDVQFTGPLAGRALALRPLDNMVGGTNPHIEVTDYYTPTTVDLTTVTRITVPA